MRKLESQVIEEFDFRKADVSGEDFTYEVDKEFINKKILRIRKRNKILHEVEKVESGDIVVCSLKSKNPKFNREKVTINAGLGLFKREIEDALVGMNKGHIKTVDTGDGSVSIEVINVKRCEIPDLTDDMVKKEKIDNVTDIKSLMEYLNLLYEEEKNKAINEKAYVLVDNVLKQVISRSRMEINEDDLQYLCQLEVQKARILAELEGLVLEMMTPEDFEGKIPVKSYDEFINMIYNINKETLPVILLGLRNAERDGYEVSREEYDEELKEYYTMFHIDPKYAARAMSFEYFEVNGYSRYYREKIKEYYKERYQEV